MSLANANSSNNKKTAMSLAKEATLKYFASWSGLIFCQYGLFINNFVWYRPLVQRIMTMTSQFYFLSNSWHGLLLQMGHKMMRSKWYSSLNWYYCIMEFGPRFGTTFDPYCSPMQQVEYGHYLKCLWSEILGVVLLSHMKDHLIPRRMQS